MTPFVRWWPCGPIGETVLIPWWCCALFLRLLQGNVYRGISIRWLLAQRELRRLSAIVLPPVEEEEGKLRTLETRDLGCLLRPGWHDAWLAVQFILKATPPFHLHSRLQWVRHSRDAASRVSTMQSPACTPHTHAAVALARPRSAGHSHIPSFKRRWLKHFQLSTLPQRLLFACKCRAAAV